MSLSKDQTPRDPDRKRSFQEVKRLQTNVFNESFLFDLETCGSIVTLWPELLQELAKARASFVPQPAGLCGFSMLKERRRLTQNAPQIRRFPRLSRPCSTRSVSTHQTDATMESFFQREWETAGSPSSPGATYFLNFDQITVKVVGHLHRCRFLSRS